MTEPKFSEEDIVAMCGSYRSMGDDVSWLTVIPMPEFGVRIFFGSAVNVHVHYYNEPNRTPALVDTDTNQVVGWQIEL